MKNSSEKQSGRTTKQILKAKQGAIYLIPFHHHLSYFKSLAHALDRNDLTIKPFIILDGFADFFRGRKFTEIVVDHSCWELLGTHSKYQLCFNNLQQIIKYMKMDE
jgi:hypothetical protein